MNFYPTSGSALHGSAMDLSSVSTDVGYNRDFNGSVKDFTYRGAYGGQGTSPDWQLADDIKMVSPSVGDAGSCLASDSAGPPNGDAGQVDASTPDGGKRSDHDGSIGKGRSESGSAGRGCGCSTTHCAWTRGTFAAFVLLLVFRRARRAL